MYYYTFASLAFVACAAAQNSTAVLPNPFQVMSTITQLAADKTATTYTNVCTRDGRDKTRPNGIAYITCAPFLLIHGPSTYEVHVTDPGTEKDRNQYNMGCKLQGGFEKDAECALSMSGAGVEFFGFPTTPKTEILKATDWTASNAIADNIMQTVKVLSAPISSSAAPNISTASTTGSSESTNRGASGSAAPSSSSFPSAKTSSGSAATVASHLDMVAWIGGAVGILAASVLL